MRREDLVEKISSLVDEITRDGVPEDKELLGAISVLCVLAAALMSGKAIVCAQFTSEFIREEIHCALGESQEIPPDRLN